MRQHLEHDRLVFLALGEHESDAGENHHLDTCARCRAELDALRHVAGIGAETQALRDLPAPPAPVWDAIAAEVAAAQALPSLTRAHDDAPATAAAPGPVDPRPADPGSVDPGSVGPGSIGARPAEPRPTDPRPVGPEPVDPPDARPGSLGARPVRSRAARRPRRVSRWVGTALTAAAAAAVGVVGTLTVVRPDAPEPPPRVLASAPLSAYGPTPPEASGDARVFADGRLHLHVSNLPEAPGYHEVWLIDPQTMEMFSVGVLGEGPDALLPLPPNVDLDRYSVVDVSAEQYDNDTAHSGDSLLRGTLTG
ncbi:anti-sigma factor [Micromonospora sp. WMMD882]|uniref:anti-sigma factor n=1 Tax=Micromonospora sp. WMMD882 TaxID=3015151 RepID=UPI00248B1F00|nr:anti-sigma factor [Micromonospora sp. WMMD882]WBB82049.1 anti-sigma factor [Micromonospora sp. WMMD882]